MARLRARRARLPRAAGPGMGAPRRTAVLRPLAELCLHRCGEFGIALCAFLLRRAIRRSSGGGDSQCDKSLFCGRRRQLVAQGATVTTQARWNGARPRRRRADRRLVAAGTDRHYAAGDARLPRRGLVLRRGKRLCQTAHGGHAEFRHRALQPVHRGGRARSGAAFRPPARTVDAAGRGQCRLPSPWHRPLSPTCSISG